MGAIMKERDTWVISLLYIGTFGSFIGFAFAFGQVLQINFAAGGQNAAQASLHAAQIAFIGPLLGSLSRVYGGRLADRITMPIMPDDEAVGEDGAPGFVAGMGMVTARDSGRRRRPLQRGQVVADMYCIMYSR